VDNAAAWPVQLEVCPAQAECLAMAQAGGQEQQIKRLQPIAADDV